MSVESNTTEKKEGRLTKAKEFLKKHWLFAKSCKTENQQEETPDIGNVEEREIEEIIDLEENENEIILFEEILDQYEKVRKENKKVKLDILCKRIIKIKIYRKEYIKKEDIQKAVFKVMQCMGLLAEFGGLFLQLHGIFLGVIFTLIGAIIFIFGNVFSDRLYKDSVKKRYKQLLCDLEEIFKEYRIERLDVLITWCDNYSKLDNAWMKTVRWIGKYFGYIVGWVIAVASWLILKLYTESLEKCPETLRKDLENLKQILDKYFEYLGLWDTIGIIFIIYVLYQSLKSLTPEQIEKFLNHKHILAGKLRDDLIQLKFQRLSK